MAKPRCKPGDLAIITRCGEPAYIGLLVLVVAPHETNDFDWNVELLGTSVKGRAIRSGRPGTFRKAAVFDWNLTPLADDLALETTEAMKVRHG